MLEKNMFLGGSNIRGLAVVAVAAFTVAMSPTMSVAMDPVDWTPGAQLLTNQFSVVGVQRIDILDIGYSGVTNDGTFFQAEPDPTNPSTGTGVFTPFKRVQRASGACGPNNDCIDIGGTTVGTENGFNTDASELKVNFDTKVGNWTRSVLMSEFNITGPGGFIRLDLDANQNGAAGSDTNKLVISDLQIFIEAGAQFKAPENVNPGEGEENSGYTNTFDPGPGTNTLLGEQAAWSLDNAVNGNVDILLQASICGTPGQCGSGKGDMSVFIPIAQLGLFDGNGNALFDGTEQFVFYSEYLYVNDGFEEWRFGDTVVGQVAEPGMLAIFGIGIIGMGVMRRRRRTRNIPG